jgi:hypothetical protein
MDEQFPISLDPDCDTGYGVEEHAHNPVTKEHARFAWFSLLAFEVAADAEEEKCEPGDYDLHGGDWVGRLLCIGEEKEVDGLLGGDLAKPEKTAGYGEGVEVDEPAVGDCEVGEEIEEVVCC